MQAKGLNAGQGVNWFKGGWDLFKQDFGTWLIMMLIFVGISIMLNLLPLIGPMAMTVISPVLVAGFMFSASEADKGNATEIGDLFQGFRDKARMNQLLILGALALGAQFLLALLTFGLIGGSVMTSVSEPGGINPQVMMGAGTMSTVLLISLLAMLVSMGFIYAAPLVMLDEMAPAKAIKSSFYACLKNAIPLLVFGLVAIGLSIVAAIPFGLGFIILIPVSFLAIFYSYKSIFH
jgi:uncharacterized membrane protein